MILPHLSKVAQVPHFDGGLDGAFHPSDTSATSLIIGIGLARTMCPSPLDNLYYVVKRRGIPAETMKLPTLVGMTRGDLTFDPSTMTPPSGQGELVVDHAHYQKIVVDGMLKARTSLAIATADLKATLAPLPSLTGRRGRRGSTHAPSIIVRLAQLASEGVEIRLLHAGVPSAAVLHELRGKRPASFRIRRCPRLHAKSVIVDAESMYLGSANLTGAGLGAKGPDKRNIEWGLWTQSDTLIDAVLDEFDALWEGHRCPSCKRRDVCPVPLEEPDL